MQMRLLVRVWYNRCRQKDNGIFLLHRCDVWSFVDTTKASIFINAVQQLLATVAMLNSCWRWARWLGHNQIKFQHYNPSIQRVHSVKNYWLSLRQSTAARHAWWKFPTTTCQIRRVACWNGRVMINLFIYLVIYSFIASESKSEQIHKIIAHFDMTQQNIIAVTGAHCSAILKE